MNRDSQRKITVEDLIRLKRAERPPAEFWAGFESQMRAKQLAAIVVKRPWWDGAARIFSSVRRHSLPVAAAASVALAWAGIRYVGVPGPAAHHAAPALAAPLAPVRTDEARPAQVARHAPAARVQPDMVAESAVQEVPAVTAAVSHVSQVVPSVAAGVPERTPFAEGIYVSLADLRETTPVLPQRDVFGSDRDFETPAAARTAAAEPLARMDPSAERRARLLAPALPEYASMGARTATSSLARDRLNDDRIYESMDLSGSSERSMVGFRF